MYESCAAAVVLLLDRGRLQDAVDDVHCIMADAFSSAAETSAVPFEKFPMVLGYVYPAGALLLLRAVPAEIRGIPLVVVEDFNLLTGLMMEMHGCLTAFLIQLDVIVALRIFESQLVLESAFFQIFRSE